MTESSSAIESAMNSRGMSDSLQVWICFELDVLDAPIPRAVKTAGRALVWRNEDLASRFIVP